MFCPKCGTQNPEQGKFCRSCGTDLGNVANALSGELKMTKPTGDFDDLFGETKSNDPDELWAKGIQSAIMGAGFLVISMALLITNVAGGKNWWWAMLFPAFALIGKGVSQIVRVKRISRRNLEAQPTSSANVLQSPANVALPPTSTDYVKRQGSIYDTGELIERPPSVTEGTTRHLEINKEGETMTLPKNWENK